MDRHERALIDTGEATPPRKECRGTCPSWCRVLSGSPGLQFLYQYSIISVHITIKFTILESYITTGTIALSRAVVPNILVSSGYQGIWIKQVLLMQLGVKQLL